MPTQCSLPQTEHIPCSSIYIGQMRIVRELFLDVKYQLQKHTFNTLLHFVFAGNPE